MPNFSVFQDFTGFSFSSAPAKGEQIYNAAKAAVEPAFKLTPGTYEEARIYAQSMGLARIAYALERARNQLNALKVVELLPELEYDWSLVPSASAGIYDRQIALSIRMKLPRGARRENVEEILRDIYGDDFILLRFLEPTEVTLWPFTPWNGPGVFSREDVSILPKFFKLKEAISPGIRTVHYEPIQENDPLTLKVGEYVSVQVENLDYAEKVLVTETGSDENGLTFSGIFLLPHGNGASVLTGTIPIWMSSQRRSYIVIDADSATDVAKYLEAAEAMNKVQRSVTQWGIVQPTTPGATTIGPFTLNITPLGTSTIGTLNFVGSEGGVPPTPATEAPYISFFDVIEGPLTGGTTVRIYGFRFTGTTSVDLSGDAATIVEVTENRITITTPAVAPGTGFANVHVVTPAGSDTLGSFEYIEPPQFGGLDVVIGPYPGGTLVKISGFYFRDLISVSFEGDLATVLWFTDTEIQLMTPFFSQGPDLSDITITTAWGSVTEPDAFEFAPL